MANYRMNYYTEKQLFDFIDACIMEDVGDGDHTSLSTIPSGTSNKAKLLVKESGIIAGVALAVKIFHRFDPQLKVEVLLNDGDLVIPGDTVLYVQGSAHSILKAERLVLNIMQRMSGIATTTRKIVDTVAHTKCRILDTRKTTPGLRFLEKEAVLIGGGYNHRFGLFDMILIKDNHVDYAGGITNALKNAKQYLKDTRRSLPIEIETRTLEEVKEALKEGGFVRIMFDNFSFEDLKKAIELVGDQYETEASGGITSQNVIQYAELGVTCISMGALTHSVKSLDLSLKAVIE
jgi:nicotinate-nucleotide pyrophosphorylase (carboxylating)